MSDLLEPSVGLLQRLVPKSSLIQDHSLCKSVRLWFGLDSLYRKPWEFTLPITFKDWYDHLFQSDRLRKKFDWDKPGFDVTRIPLDAWLMLQPEFDRDRWISEFQAFSKQDPAWVRWMMQHTYPYGFLREGDLRLVESTSIAAFEKQCAVLMRSQIKRPIVLGRVSGRYLVRAYSRGHRSQNFEVIGECDDTTLKSDPDLIHRIQEAFESPIFLHPDPDQLSPQDLKLRVELIQWLILPLGLNLNSSYRRLLRNDFKVLGDLGLVTQSVSQESNQQCLGTLKFDVLEGGVEEVRSHLKLDHLTSESSAHGLVKTFASEELSGITKKYLSPIQGVQRYFMDLVYVVNEDGNNVIDALGQFLYEQVWQRGNVPPLVSFQYLSAAGDSSARFLIYPIAIRYSRRAPYLTGYGFSPDSPDQLNYYNYRMDRMVASSVVDWPTSVADLGDIPTELWEEYRDDELPTTEEMQEEMNLAWGFDVGLPVEPMILRFERAFHDRYIHESDRHNSFERFEIESPRGGVRLSAAQRQQWELEALSQRLGYYTEYGDDEVGTFYQLADEDLLNIYVRMRQYPEDAYYFVLFRAIDNNIVMRLRAWGPAVEVLYPPALRQRMEDDLTGAIAMYG